MGELDDSEQGFWRDRHKKLEKRSSRRIQGLRHVRNRLTSRMVRPGNRSVSGCGMSPCWVLGVRFVRKGMASSQPSVMASVMSPNRRSISPRAFSCGTACGIVTILLAKGGRGSSLRMTSSHGLISPASCCRLERSRTESSKDGEFWSCHRVCCSRASSKKTMARRKWE